MEDLLGPIQRQSPLFPFPETRRYSRTMGSPLARVFYVFGGFFPQDCLPEVKRLCCNLEEQVAAARRYPVLRPVNLDPGLLSEGRVVLASTKDRGHRMPRAGGIYEEITLLYHEGGFQPLLWTYRDFQSPQCRAFFEQVRAEFLAETREVRERYRKRAEEAAKKWERLP